MNVTEAGIASKPSVEITQREIDAAFNRDPVTPAYRSDCQRICKIAATRWNLSLTEAQAERIWRVYSLPWYTAWAQIENEDEILVAITQFVRGKLA